MVIASLTPLFFLLLILSVIETFVGCLAVECNPFHFRYFRFLGSCTPASKLTPWPSRFLYSTAVYLFICLLRHYALNRLFIVPVTGAEQEVLLRSAGWGEGSVWRKKLCWGSLDLSEINAATSKCLENDKSWVQRYPTQYGCFDTCVSHKYIVVCVFVDFTVFTQAWYDLFVKVAKWEAAQVAPVYARGVMAVTRNLLLY